MSESPARRGRIILVGFMGAGKSTVGRVLARRLGWRFVDLDDRIERLAGRTIAEIFAAEGEASFRELEAEATRSLDTDGDVVLATGGGWVTQPELRALIGADDVVVWLRVSAGVGVRRALADGRPRPLLAGPDPLADAAMLMRTREHYYGMSDIVVDTDACDPDAVADAILNQLEV